MFYVYLGTENVYVYQKFVVYAFLVTRLSVFLPKITSPTLL